MPAETTNPRAPQPKSVAVIGAGAAGIIAGKELMDLGHRVEIFELDPDFDYDAPPKTGKKWSQWEVIQIKTKIKK